MKTLLALLALLYTRLLSDDSTSDSGDSGSELVKLPWTRPRVCQRWHSTETMPLLALITPHCLPPMFAC